MSADPQVGRARVENDRYSLLAAFADCYISQIDIFLK